jgi:hypothetical protein
MNYRLLLMLFLVLAAIANPFDLSAQDEPDEITERLIPYTELDTPYVENPCIPMSNITKSSVVNFESGSVLYFKSDEPDLLFTNGKLTLNSQADYVEFTAEQPTQDVWKVHLESNRDYEIMGWNTCGDMVVLQKISTHPKTISEIIKVDNNLGESLSQWKMSDGGEDLYDYLYAQDGVDPFEINAFLQDFVSDGRLLPDAYMNEYIIPKYVFTDPVDPDPSDPSDPPGDPTDDCTCRVLQITATSEIYPTSSGQNSSTISPAVFPNTVIRETNRIKFWHAGSFEGPARYQQIWGHTKRCRNVTERAKWGDNSSHSLSNALGRAAIRVEQLCKSGNWKPGDCYCTQNLSFEYRYDAQLDARSGERSGWCFNPPGKKAQAIVDDVAIVMVGRRNNPANPMSTDPVWYDVAAGGVASNCNRDFQEKRFIDVIKLGLAVYAYIKGVPIVINNPAINSVANAIWDEYQKSLFFDALTNLTTEPWVTGSCTQVTDNYNLANSVNLQIFGKDALIFTLTAASYLEVNGMTAWDANGRVLSGFSTSVVINKNENVGQENEYCCTKAAGIYQHSTLHPIHGPSTYKQVIGSHFAPQLGSCAPTSPFTGQVLINDDRNIIICDEIPDCETTINNRSIDSDGVFAAEVEQDITIRFMGDGIWSFGLNERIPYQAEMYTLDGKLVASKVVAGPEAVLFEQASAQWQSGIYLVRLSGGEKSVTQKIFIP